MTRPKSLLSVLAPCLVFLTGCGGNGGGSSEASPFQGSYTGTYSAPFVEDSGTYDVTVSRSGSISGTGTSTTSGSSGSLTGRIRSSGEVTASLRFSSGSTATLSGTLTQGTDGTLSGTLSETIQGQTGDVSVVLTPAIAM